MSAAHPHGTVLGTSNPFIVRGALDKTGADQIAKDLVKQLESIFKAVSLSDKAGAVKFVPIVWVHRIAAGVFAVLGLLFVEVFLAWRAGHARA